MPQNVVPSFTLFIHNIIVYFLVRCVELAENVFRRTKIKFDSIWTLNLCRCNGSVQEINQSGT